MIAGKLRGFLRVIKSGGYLSQGKQQAPYARVTISLLSLRVVGAHLVFALHTFLEFEEKIPSSLWHFIMSITNCEL